MPSVVGVCGARLGGTTGGYSRHKGGRRDFTLYSRFDPSPGELREDRTVVCPPRLTKKTRHRTGTHLRS